MIIWLLACAPEPLSAQLTVVEGGLLLEADRAVDQVELLDGAGELVVRQSGPGQRAFFRVPLSPGTWTARVGAGESQLEVHTILADPGPFSVRVEAPLGQGRLSPGTALRLPDGHPVQAGIVIEAHQDVAVVSPLLDGPLVMVAGSRETLVHEVGVGGLQGVFEAGGERREVQVDAVAVPLATWREQLWVGPITVPARPDGTVDPTLQAGRVPQLAGWWRAVLDGLSLGYRPRDDLAPRTFVGIALRNDSEQALQVLVESEVRVAGVAASAFRPRLRDEADLTWVRRLVRVPPGETVPVGLPLYADSEALQSIQAATVHVRVRALGTEVLLHERTLEVRVGGGAGLTSLLLMLGVLVAGLGWVHVYRSLSTWLQRPTRELTTLATLSAVGFVVRGAALVLGAGAATVLGPFSPFLFGWLDKCLGTAVLATLLTLCPAPGTLALSVLLSWTMGALTLGAFHPIDVLHLGLGVAVYEGAFHLSRGEHWGLWRLIGVLALPSAVLTAFSLAVSIVVYRLWYADLYCLAMVVGPGLLYPAVGCGLALPVVRQLQRLAP